jgi:pimeloyl-ACP methyl ester carboxylesterase
MQNSIRKDIPSTLTNAQGENLEFTYHPGSPDSNRLVVIAHGVTGNKDRPLLVTLAEALAQAGFHALRFSFSGNGGSEGRFEESTITKEIEDLGSVLSALEGWEIGYVGHSMGAAVGVLRAVQDPRIRFLVSLGGMAHTADFAQREFGMETPGKGFMWDNPACPLSELFMRDMQTIGNVTQAASQVSVPWLFVHGTADDVVPMQDSQDLAAVCSSKYQLSMIQDADHVFSGEHEGQMAKLVVEALVGKKLDAK